MSVLSLKWQLENHVAQLAGKSMSARLDVARPFQGIHVQRLQDTSPLGFRLLGFRGWSGSPLADSPDPPVECYIRGTDLIAAYQHLESRLACPQVYWRAVETPDWFGIQLIVSQQTSYSDSDPSLTTLTRIPRPSQVLALPEWEAQDWLEPIVWTQAQFSSPLFLVRWDGCPFSYVELVMPSDAIAADLSTGSEAEPAARLCFQLLAERLEKGVIRRARLCGYFVRRERDASVAMECFRQFLREPPPLTA